MKEQLENRIQELRTELESGQKMMEELDAKRTNLGYTILRISGAIQVLEEMLGKGDEKQESQQKPQ